MRRLWPFALLTVTVTTVVLMAWPGRMSSDTLSQLQQLRAGQYSDWHAPLLMVLWRPFWLLGIGPGWVVWLTAMILAASIYRLLRVRFTRGGAAIAASVILVLPQVIGHVIYLSRDTWFTTSFIAACAALLAATGTTGRARLVRLGVLVVALWVMQAARQNAMPVVVVLAVAATRIAPIPRPNRPDGLVAHGWRAAATAVAAAGITVAAIMGSQTLMKSWFDVAESHPEQAVMIYDVAAISHAEGTVLFDERFVPARDIDELNARWNGINIYGFVFTADPMIPFPMSPDEYRVLREDWVDAVTGHPFTYLKERMLLWLASSSVTHSAVWIAHPGIDANTLGYEPLLPAADAAIQDYITFFAGADDLRGGPIHVVWQYLLVLAAGLLHLRSAAPSRRLLGWSCLAAWAYQGSLFFGLMVVNYRFNVSCVLLALVIGAIALADAAGEARSRLARRRSGTPVTATTPAPDDAAVPEVRGDVASGDRSRR